MRRRDLLKGIAGLAAVSGLTLVPGCGGGRLPKGTNLLLVSLDTTRADTLGLYGCERENITPNLDRLAAESVVFDRAFVQATNTNPSHVSYFTGLYPRTHGNLVNGAFLKPKIPTLAGHMKNKGFYTGAVISGSTLKVNQCGLMRGFDKYDQMFTTPHDARQATDRAIKQLDVVAEADRPWMLFVHYFDPHRIYIDRLEKFPEVFTARERKQAGQLSSNDTEQRKILWKLRYLSEIAYTDFQLGRLLNFVFDQGLDRNTAICVFSDHGETLEEREPTFDHGGRTFHEQMRAVLLFRLPAGQAGGRRIDEIVESVDLAPTVSDMFGLKWEGPLEGISLAPLLYAEPGAKGKPFAQCKARCETGRYPHLERKTLDREDQVVALYDGRYKIVRYPLAQNAKHRELFDLQEDPAETRDVSADLPEQLSRMQALQEGVENVDYRTIPKPRIDPETIEELRSLGYLR